MLSDRLISERKRKNYTQQRVADYLGLTRPAYTAYERGTRQPDYDTLKKLSDLYDVSLDFLITGNEHSKSPDEMWQEFLDPKTQIFFKDLQSAPEEKIEELIRFWEFIKERDKKQ
ncbi:helix-turn-helix transcriptional regulator [Bacillus sp. ISL-53]|nr:helix-turn-helix transcriptional regulator [Bacillus sp. ISL-53]